MKTKLYIVEQKEFDSKLIEKQDGLRIVSFKLDVLDKYDGNPDYEIKLNNDVGTITSKNGWILQIDVHYTCQHVNTWLYKFLQLPDNEILYFTQHNIYPRELSVTAFNRWTQGLA